MISLITAVTSSLIRTISKSFAKSYDQTYYSCDKQFHYSDFLKFNQNVKFIANSELIFKFS